MKNLSMAEAYMERADACLREAKGAIKRRDYPGVVRRSQECVEFALKGAMRLYGIEHPRRHDVKSVLSKVAKRFPKWFSEHVDEFSEISERMAKDRGPSMYGDEEKGIPPSEIFLKDDAESALESAGHVYSLCSKLLRRFKKRSKS